MQNEIKESEQLQHSLVNDLIKEKRSDRLWRNIRFFIGLFFVVIVFFSVFSRSAQAPLSEGEGDEYVALIRLDGMIAPGESFSSENVIPLLQEAFSDSMAKGVILDINSGGGTPVQASIIHDAILEMKKKYHKKIIVVGEDMLASGAYFVAVAADKIYVNPNALTGSIGVIMKGFGFPELIKKIGVERRVYTAGAEKDRLDPFLPQSPADVEKISQVISEVHENFKEVVIEGRKGKLKADPDTLFSGDFWSGKTAVKLGLVDGLGNLSDVMRSEFNVTRYKDYTYSGSVLKALAGQLGASLDTMLNASEVRLLEKI